MMTGWRGWGLDNLLTPPSSPKSPASSTLRCWIWHIWCGGYGQEGRGLFIIHWNGKALDYVCIFMKFLLLFVAVLLPFSFRCVCTASLRLGFPPAICDWFEAGWLPPPRIPTAAEWLLKYSWIFFIKRRTFIKVGGLYLLWTGDCCRLGILEPPPPNPFVVLESSSGPWKK